MIQNIEKTTKGVAKGVQDIHTHHASKLAQKAIETSTKGVAKDIPTNMHHNMFV